MLTMIQNRKKLLNFYLRKPSFRVKAPVMKVADIFFFFFTLEIMCSHPIQTKWVGTTANFQKLLNFECIRNAQNTVKLG